MILVTGGTFDKEYDELNERGDNGRVILRGGSWKDVGYFLRCGTRAYEYQDTTKSYIGFRCVIDLPPASKKRGK